MYWRNIPDSFVGVSSRLRINDMRLQGKLFSLKLIIVIIFLLEKFRKSSF